MRLKHIFMLLVTVLVAVTLQVAVVGKSHGAPVTSSLSVDSVCLDHETISTMTSAKGFTTAKIRPTGTYPGKSAIGALVTVETAPVRILMDGTTPTVTGGANEGRLMPAGSSILLMNERNVGNFKAINATDANGAKLIVEYFFNVGQ